MTCDTSLCVPFEDASCKCACHEVSSLKPDTIAEEVERIRRGKAFADRDVNVLLRYIDQRIDAEFELLMACCDSNAKFKQERDAAVARAERLAMLLSASITELVDYRSFFDEDNDDCLDDLIRSSREALAENK